MWWLAALCVVFVFSFARSTAAQGIPAEHRVCARPPNVPPGVERWAYPPSGLVLLTTDPEQFRRMTEREMVFVFDPFAPPESVRVLPIPHNTLPCASFVLPRKVPSLPTASVLPPSGGTPLPKGTGPGDESSGQRNDAKVGATDKKGGAEGVAEPLPKPIYRPPPPAPEERPMLPRGGVTARWPKTVLPIKRRAGSGGESSGSGDAPHVVAKKTAFEKLAEEMAYAAAMANLQMNENTKRPDGQRHGIPSGKNVTGPNSPAVQAAVSALMVAAVALSAGAGGFKKKLIAALKKGEPLAYKEMADLGTDAAEELAKKYGYKITQALHVNGAIGPYSVMRKFTDNLGGRYQAHHILEEQMIRKFKLGKPELGPSVILTDAEHMVVTAKLAQRTVHAKTTQYLWQAYEGVYKAHPPHWLESIKPYFVKAKK